MSANANGYDKDRLWLINTTTANSERLTLLEDRVGGQLQGVLVELSQLKGQVQTLVALMKQEATELSKMRRSQEHNTSSILRDILLAVITSGATLGVALISGIIGLFQK